MNKIGAEIDLFNREKEERFSNASSHCFDLGLIYTSITYTNPDRAKEWAKVYEHAKKIVEELEPIYD